MYLTSKAIYAIAMADAMLGTIIFCVCACRLFASSKRVIGRVRLKYIVLGPAAFTFGWSMLWGDMPGMASPLLLAATLIGLIAEMFQWKNGPPDNVLLDTMPSDLRNNL